MMSTVKAIPYNPLVTGFPKESTNSVGHRRKYGHIPPTKTQFFGIEVNGPFIWKDWIPGREYSKQISLKNVKFKSDNIEFNLPSTRIFSTVYPKKLKLSPGTSYSIPVTFRPLELIEYRDCITITTSEGKFNIDFTAILPKMDIGFPEMLDFGMCAIHDFCQIPFELTNTGDLSVMYQWETDASFSIDPIEGIIDPQQSVTHTATFRPTSGLVYESDVTCKYGPDQTQSKVLKLQGIGKYSHILVSVHGEAPSPNHDEIKAIVDFGTVAVGDIKQKWIDLHNLSPVKAPFKIEYQAGLCRIDTVFTSPNLSGVVDPMTSITIPLLYTPKVVNSFNIDYINVFSGGNLSKSVVKCSGTATGPLMMFSSSSMNFNVVDIGDRRQLSVSLVNLGLIKAMYQFCIDSTESVFKINAMSGEVAANDTKQILIDFVPTAAINYYRRVTCLVHDQDPIFLDLVGTCHSDFIKPAMLSMKHIARYRKNVENRTSHYPPEQVKEMLQQKTMFFDKDGALKHHKKPVLFHWEKDEELNEECVLEPSAMDEHFNGGYFYTEETDKPHISLDVGEVDFGRCENLRFIENKVIHLTNHTKGRVTVNWMTDDNRTFSVFPTSVDVPGDKTMEFQLRFKPNAPNQMFASELECYASFKALRDFSLVDDATFTPPWCLTLPCNGHTFHASMETFLPRCSILPETVLFHPANQHEASYRTMLLTNHGHTPVMFDLKPEGPGVFCVKPTKSIVPIGEHRIVVLKARPAEVKSYKHPLNIRLNDSQANDQKLELFLPCETATILLDNDAEIYFKPTCIGSSSQTFYSFRNISRIPIAFEWKLQHRDAKVVSVEPSSGIIQPNEHVTQRWTFTPNDEKKVCAKPQIVVWGDGLSEEKSGGKRKMYSVRAIGEGTRGVIRSVQSYVNIGNVAVTSQVTQKVALYNDSDCDLHYRLKVTETLNVVGADGEVISNTDGNALTLEKVSGLMAARSYQPIQFTVTPRELGEYQIAISYDLLTAQGVVIPGLSDNDTHLCHVLLSGVYPALVITDAVCGGSNEGMSKRQIWSLLSINDYDTSRQLTNSALDFNFGAAPINSEPAVITLMLENPGPVPTEWHCMLLFDLQHDLHHWTRTGEFNERQLSEMQIQDNLLFMIEPQHGRLKSGETQSVTFTYKHMLAGTNRLPVLLKLTRGREITLNFIGVTVEADRRYIHFPSNSFQFTPVAVGDQSNPVQIYEMYNGGSVPLTYHIDLTPLDIIRQENFDQMIFDCLNPDGEILPGRTAQISWCFDPIEVKTYVVDVRISVEEGDSTVVTFTGIGYDGHALGDTMTPAAIAESSENVPTVQNITLDSQLVYLSVDRINMDNISLYSQCRRVVFVMNKSRYVVSYHWRVASKADCNALSIYPVHGQLQPGESRLCRVIFTALGEPSFHDLDLVCEVKNETMFAKYEKELDEWQAEHYRQRTEFVVTESNPDADRVNTPILDVLVRPPSRQLEAVKAPPCMEMQLMPKYKTLPPINISNIDDWYADKQRRKREGDTWWEKPTPPMNSLLHLSITARTHNVPDFQTNFPKLRKRIYVDRFLSSEHRTITFPWRSAKKKFNIVVCKESEKDLLNNVMANIVRSLMDDGNFQDTIHTLADEPTPYFVQYTDKHHPRQRITHTPEAALETCSLPAVLDYSAPNKIGEYISHSLLLTYDTSFMELVASSRRPSDSHIDDLSKESLQKKLAAAKEHTDRQDIKKRAELGSLVENCLENTLMNIMMEALTNETSLTSRPCFAALPPRRKSAKDLRFLETDHVPKITRSADAGLYLYSHLKH